MKIQAWSLVILLVLGALAPLAAQNKDGEVSEALKTKYSPLIDAFQQSMDHGEYDQALEQILSIKAGTDKEKELTPTHPVSVQINLMVCQIYFELKKYKEAEAVLTDLTARLSKAKLQDSVQMYWVDQTAVELYQRSGNPSRQKARETKVEATLQKHPEWRDEGGDRGGDRGPGPENRFKPEVDKVWQLFNEGHLDEAIRLAEGLTKKVDQELGPEDPMAIEAWRVLAVLDRVRGDDATGTAILERLAGIILANKEKFGMGQVFILSDLVNAYRDQGQQDKVDSLVKQIDALVADNPDMRHQWREEQGKQDEKRKQSAQIKESQGDRGALGPKDGGPDFGLSEEQVAALEADPQTSPLRLAALFLDRSREADNQGDLSRAVAGFEKSARWARQAQDSAQDKNSKKEATDLWMRATDGLTRGYARQNRFAEAEPLAKDLLAVLDKNQPDDRWTFGLLQILGEGYRQAGRTKDLEPVAARMTALLAQMDKSLPRPDPNKPDQDDPQVELGRHHAQLADLDLALKKTKDALDQVNKALALLQKTPLARNVPWTVQHLADLLVQLGRPQDATKVWTSLVQAATKDPSFDPNQLGGMLLGYGRHQVYTLKDRAGAEKSFQQALKAFGRADPPQADQQFDTLNELRVLYESQNRQKDLTGILDQMKTLQGRLGTQPGDWRRQIDLAMQDAGQHRDDYAVADRIIQAMLDQVKAENGEDSQPYATALFWTWNFYNPDAQHSPRDQNGLLEQAIAIFARVGDTGGDYVEVLQRMGRYYTNEGHDLNRADDYLTRAASIAEASVPEALPGVLVDLGQEQVAAQRYPEAEKTLLKAVGVNARSAQPDEGFLGKAQAVLGQVYLAQGRLPEAEKALLQAEGLYDKLTKKYNEYHPDYRGLYATFVQLYSKTGNKAQAQKYQDNLKKVGG